MNWTNWLQQLIAAIGNWIRKCLTVYEPAVWNDNDGIEENNNCYNYACNIKNGTFAQPGTATGHPYPRPIDCDTGCGCRDCCHQVALVVAPGRGFNDYHWYRRDRDGKWSHKPGSTPATNLDSSGNPITDPRTADRGLYTVFCGCYCVCEGKVTIA